MKAETVQLLELQASAKQISILESIDPDLSVYADGEICRMVLRNLLSNAVKFVREEGSISKKGASLFMRSRRRQS